MGETSWKVLQGDALEVLKTLEDESVQMCVTSPPYYGLRDYGTGKWVGGDPNCPHFRTSKYSENMIIGQKAMLETGHAIGDVIYKKVCPLCGAVREDKQIGLEETPEEYIDALADAFDEVKRVLKPDGTLWINIGDSYAGSGKGAWENKDDPKESYVPNADDANVTMPKTWNGIKPKDMIGIPWMLAFELRRRGWWLRQDIIWNKVNAMPSSVTDRCVTAHEYIFLLSKSKNYYFDHEAIQEVATGYDGRKDTMLKGSPKYENDMFLPDGENSASSTFQSRPHERWRFKNLQDKGQTTHSMHEKMALGEADIQYPVRNKRDVWSVPTKPYNGAHFATYPEKLIEPCILAGCPKDGIVLDPFNGAGTTGVVCLKNDRKYIGIELNPEYIFLSEKRLKEVQEEVEWKKAQVSFFDEEMVICRK